MGAHHGSGHVRIIERRSGPVAYAKLKLPDGSEPQRKLGRVHVHKVGGQWKPIRSKPPRGVLTLAQAQARVEAILAGDDAMMNLEPTAAVVTFAQACDEHLRYLDHDKQRKRSYLNDVRSIVRAHLRPLIGADTPVTAITTDDVDRVREQLFARGLAHRTVQKSMILLGGILGRAKRKGWIATNPAENAERVSVRHGDEFNVLSVEQVHAVARAADESMIAAMILVAAFTGLRLGELLALRWRHVDFANRILHVRRNLPAGAVDEESPKSHRVRSVPLSDQAMVALDGLSRRGRDVGDDDLVFGDEAGGHLSGDPIRDAFYEALEAAELGHLRAKADPIVFHDLRHTMGTLCAAAGIDLRRIQAWMGHADIQTTMRYLHYVPQHDDAARMTAAFTAERVPPRVPRTTEFEREATGTSGADLAL
jgi:integrase